MIFTSLEQTERFKKDNVRAINKLINEANSYNNVDYCDIWLNGKVPSFVAGFNNEDIMIVCLPLSHIETIHINDYKICFNPFHRVFQISHPDIGTCEEFLLLAEAITYCEKG